MANEITSYLVNESNRIGTNITQKMMTQQTPWITLYNQETWVEQTSVVQQTFQWDRAQLLAGAEVAWQNVATNTGQSNGGTCIPLADDVVYTQTFRSFNLQQKAIWGPRICVNDLRDPIVREKQMNASVKALSDMAREIWINRKRSEYYRIADNLVVADSAFALTGGGYNNLAFPAYSGTDASILTNGFTDYVYEYLNHQGAQDGALGMSDGRPIYAMIVSPRTSRRLIHTDANIREDFRFSSQNEKLLGPMGIKYSYNGFSHIIDEKVLRFNFAPATAATAAVSGTTLTLSAAPSVPVKVGDQIVSGANRYIVVAILTTTTFTVTSGTGGPPTAQAAAVFSAWLPVPQYVKDTVGGSPTFGKQIPNPAWLNAAWEDTVFFHQKVCTSLVPKPITSVGQATFDPVNYSGEFSFKNYPDETLNPDGTIGRFRGVLMNGTRPDNPEFGIVVRHLACSAITDIVDCADLGG